MSHSSAINLLSLAVIGGTRIQHSDSKRGGVVWCSQIRSAHRPTQRKEHAQSILVMVAAVVVVVQLGSNCQPENVSTFVLLDSLNVEYNQGNGEPH